MLYYYCKPVAMAVVAIAVLAAALPIIPSLAPLASATVLPETNGGGSTFGEDTILSVTSPSNWSLSLAQTIRDDRHPRHQQQQQQQQQQRRRRRLNPTLLLRGSTMHPPFVHCGGRRFVLGRELSFSAPFSTSGSHLNLGSWRGIGYNLSTVSAAVGSAWAPPVRAHTVVMQVQFRYFSSVNAFVFDHVLPLGCERGMNASALPLDAKSPNDTLYGDEDAARSVGSGFPVMDAGTNSILASKSMGYAHWAGVFSWKNSHFGRALGRFVPGTRGGPLALFNASTGRDVLVMSPLDRFFTAALGMETCRTTVPTTTTTITNTTTTSSAPTAFNPNPNQCTLHQGVDYVGNDLHSVTTSTVEGCCAACVAEPSCTCFSYANNVSAGKQGPHTCWLKTSTGGVMASPHVSGTVCAAPSARSLALGAQGYETAAHPGATLSFLVVPSMGQSVGLNGGMARWGQVLRTYHQTHRNMRTDITRFLGYGTDNGAVYSGHLSNLTQTPIIAAVRGLRRANVPVRYVQLDPWWFRAQAHWDPDPSAFPSGLQSFSRALARKEDCNGDCILRHGGGGGSSSSSSSSNAGDANSGDGGGGGVGGIGAGSSSSATMMPLLLYSFQWGANTANDAQYRALGYRFDASTAHVRAVNGDRRIVSIFYQPTAETASRFYEHIFARHNTTMAAYETDFMNNNLWMRSWQRNASKIEAWVDAQDSYLSAHNMSWQLCMTLPSFLMDSVKRPSITNARATTDNSPVIPNRWRIGYTSILLHALGIRPFFDNTWTQAAQPGNWYGRNKNNTELNNALAVLSGGPVWIGDGVNATNATLANMTCRADGRLLPLSRPVTPLDRTFIRAKDTVVGESGPEVWLGHVDVGVDLTSSSTRGTRLQGGGGVGAGAEPDDVDVDVGIHTRASGGSHGELLFRAYTVVGVDVVQPQNVGISDLWPTPPTSSTGANPEYLVARNSRHCAPAIADAGVSDTGATAPPQILASSCGIVRLGPESPLVFSTAGQDMVTNVHGFEIFTLTPVLSNGYAFLGEVAKFARLSPERFTRISVGNVSGDRSESESGDHGPADPRGASGVEFEAVGAPGESVTVQCVNPVGLVHQVTVVVGADGTTSGLCQ